MIRVFPTCAVLALLVALHTCLPTTARAQEFPEGASGWTPKELVTQRHAMVVAAHPAAVDAGMAMLAQGGNAIDAAIAVQLVLNLVEPQSSGIGGGAFMLFHNGRTGALTTYDGRETAPAAARPDRFLDAAGKPRPFGEAIASGRSVGVPGVLRMLELAHHQFGRLPWRKLFDPAIALARDGFPVSPRLHALLMQVPLTQPRARDYFYGADGAPLAVGHVLRSPAMAATLQRLATHGAQAFYDADGDIARDIVATVREARDPGDMTTRDIAGYKARVREPVCAPYRRYRVCGMPPPSSGGIALLQMLGILERFDLGALAPESALSVHLFSEAGRLAYADRDRYIADPAFVALPEGLLGRDYLQARASEIRIDATMVRAEPGRPEAVRAPAKAAFADGAAADLPSTSQISIVDRNGNAVSMTTSIEFAFGSGLMTRSGFLLNNQLTDFSFVPERDGRPVANRVEPGKRPRSSMAPTLVYDAGGRLYMVTGSPGGPAIINYVAKSVVAVLDWKLDAQAATDLPNLGSRNGPTELERGTAAEALEPVLRALGHDTRLVGLTSGVNVIVRRGPEWTGGSDPRREGVARGN